MKYRIYERLTVLYDEWKYIYIYIAGTSDISDMSLSFVTFSMYLMWRGNKQQLQPCHTTLITFVIETLILRRVRYTRPFTYCGGYGTPVWVAYMRYISLQCYICLSSEWHMRYGLYGSNISYLVVYFLPSTRVLSFFQRRSLDYFYCSPLPPLTKP